VSVVEEPLELLLWTSDSLKSMIHTLAPFDEEELDCGVVDVGPVVTPDETTEEGGPDVIGGNEEEIDAVEDVDSVPERPDVLGDVGPVPEVTPVDTIAGLAEESEDAVAEEAVHRIPVPPLLLLLPSPAAVETLQVLPVPLLPPLPPLLEAAESA
jgi:hypothetical protein